MPYKRRVPCVSISPHVKYPSVNAKKFGMSITDSAEKCGFGSSTERFHQSAYYLEHGEPGGNRLFSPQVGKSYVRDTVSSGAFHGPNTEKPAVKGLGSPEDATKGTRGWCGGVHQPSFAPKAVDPLLLKGANLMELAGNETRLQELQRLRERKLAPSPGPGAYELSGDIRSYHKSYRRPESGGPKQYVDGRSMRALDTDMHWQTDGYCGRVRGSPGPGHYDAETSRDRTQSRRLQQPVIANYKRGHTKKAECLSITLLTGHHWKEKVPQLGNGIADAAGQAPRHPSNRRDGFTEDPTRGSSEYRRQQVELDTRLSQPKVRRNAHFTAPQLPSFSPGLRSVIQSQQTATSRSSLGWERQGSPNPESGLFADVHERCDPMPAEFPGRSPSAPPQETVDDKFVEALMHGIREEQSDALFVGSGSFQEPKALKVDNPMGEMRRNEAAHAAQMALETEQRRMEWQIRSSFQGVLSGFAPRDTF